MTDSNLPPTVVEIRCLCLRNRFNIRTSKEKKMNVCSMCMRAYVVRLYPNGAVTVHVVEKFGIEEHLLERQHYSIVTDGE